LAAETGDVILMKFVPLVAALTLAMPSMAMADSDLTGPAAKTVAKWFTTDRSLNCYDRQGNESGCRLDPDSNVFVKYAPAGDTAVAFATYVNDPTGNAEMFAVAVFRKAGDGWRFVRNVPGLGGRLAKNVAFRGDKVGFDTEVWRKGDGHCCPTGVKHWTVSLR
jgi:hypothetical protein